MFPSVKSESVFNPPRKSWRRAGLLLSLLSWLITAVILILTLVCIFALEEKTPGDEGDETNSGGKLGGRVIFRGDCTQSTRINIGLHLVSVKLVPLPV